MIEIARFCDHEDALLAAEFLYRHGISATAPTREYSRAVGIGATGAVGQTPVLVHPDQASEAAELLRRVLAGEFADEDPTRNSRAGLGAALAKAVLSEPGYQPPSLLQGLAPVIVLLGAGLAGFIGPLIFELVRARATQ